jgi:hypothetical protein
MTVQEADKKRWGGGEEPNLPTISLAKVEKTMREI